MTARPARLRVAVARMRFHASVAGNLGRIGDAAAEAARLGADAILFPECATTGYAGDLGAVGRGDGRPRATIAADGLTRACDGPWWGVRIRAASMDRGLRAGACSGS